MTENELAKIIVNAAFKIHRKLGPGLLESSYEACLIYELSQAGLRVNSQVSLPLIYDDVYLDCGYRIDILVEDRVIIEVKSVQEIMNIHQAQVITYLKLSGCTLALLINFNVPQIKYGIKRIINGYLDE